MYSMCVTLECMCLLFATSMSFKSLWFLLVSLCLVNIMCNSFVLCPTCWFVTMLLVWQVLSTKVICNF